MVLEKSRSEFYSGRGCSFRRVDGTALGNARQNPDSHWDFGGQGGPTTLQEMELRRLRPARPSLPPIHEWFS